jgi:hypothetical protein
MYYIYGMKIQAIVITSFIAAFLNVTPLQAHTNGATSIHEISQEAAPRANLEIKKDPTGGYNVHVVTNNFVWRPEMASMEHIPGEGHAHVFLDGRKIMRIYNEWFHLNTYQFSTRSGEQLLSIEFVGNDHAPYTINGLPVGAEQIVDVPDDEIQPTSKNDNVVQIGLLVVLVFALAGLLFRRKRAK